MKKSKLIFSIVLAMIMAVTMSIPAVASAKTDNTNGFKSSAIKIQAGENINNDFAISANNIGTKFGAKATPKAAGSIYAQAGDVFLVSGANGAVATFTGPSTITGYLYSSGYTYVNVPVTGTYTINNASVTSVLRFSGANRTITSGKEYAVANYNTSTKMFKFKATKTGYVSFIGSKTLNGNITLTNSKGKALSRAGYYNGGSQYPYQRVMYYGVKKGSTYYFKVYGYGGYSSNGMYGIKYVNTGIKEYSGSKKSKSKKIKRNKVRKGTISAGSSKVDWYKFTTSKTKNYIYLTGATNDVIKARVYHKRGRIYIKRTMYLYRNTGYKLTTKGNAMKGTYYIKVYRGNKSSSGMYQLKWK